MPKAFLVKKDNNQLQHHHQQLQCKTDFDGAENINNQDSVVAAQAAAVAAAAAAGEPLMDQQVPSNGGGYFYHPTYFYPQEYYSSYLPTLWARHYQEMTAGNNWQNGFGATDKTNFMPNINLQQSLSLPAQMNNFHPGNFNTNNTMQTQPGAGLSSFFPHQPTQPTDQFQQQFQSFFPQQTQQLNQPFGMTNQDQQNPGGQFETGSADKVKRDLYNEFFDLDNNAIGKEANMLLPNAVAAVLDGQVPRVKRRRRADGSETDSISSNDSNRSDHSSAAIVDSIINSGLEGLRRNDKGVSITGLNGELLSPKMEEGEKIYKCEYCNKKFSRSWNYQRHVLIHSGRKPHKCDVCGKAFVLAAHLKIHMRIHTGEKPYKCNVCGRGFAQLTNLQRHVLTHTGQKPHRCQHCNKGFVSSSDLRRHIRIHTGEKPYQCNACTKAFTTSGNLQSHILTHTGVKPYSCSICKWKFISSSNLRTHLRTHHCSDSEANEQLVPDNNLSIPNAAGIVTNAA